MKPLKKKFQKPLVTAAAAVGTSALVVSAAVMAVKMIGAPSSNPWDYTMYAFDTGEEALKSNAALLKADGDVRSNGGAVFGDGETEITGNLVVSGAVSTDKGTLRTGKLTEHASPLAVNQVFSDVFREATANHDMLYKDSLTDFSLQISQPVIGEGDLNVQIRRNNTPDPEAQETISYKSGAFGAAFMADVYNRPDEWKQVLPFLFESGETPEQDYAGLGAESAFLPVDGGSAAKGWKNADRLPEDVFANHLSAEDFSTYISAEKKNNPVFNICRSTSKPVEIEANYNRLTVNPKKAADASKIVVTGGNFALDGDYENLEEIRFNNWGGAQLHGYYPNLKYIYMPTWSNLNLAGEFPALECVYLNGGQILLGSGEEGFSAQNATILAENGTVIVYTAKDVALTDCRVLSMNNIVMRGDGAEGYSASFTAENSLFATKGAISFEDMHDINRELYADLPVFYSERPVSVVNSDIALLQGCFLSRTGAMVLTESEIGALRGFLFAPGGIDSNALNSTAHTYINTYSYNISPQVRTLNTQQSGAWKKGTVQSLQEARFPVSLAGTITDIAGFLSDSISLRNEAGEYEEVYSYKGAAANGGILTLDSALIAEGNVNVTADTLRGGNETEAMIVSRSGDITVQVSNVIDWTGIIFAPNGKVTLDGEGTLHGRIFAKEIEIVSDALTVAGGNMDLAARGFKKPAETSSETDPPETEPVPTDTEPVPTDTEPVPTDTEPATDTTEAEPVVTTTDTTVTEPVTEPNPVTTEAPQTQEEPGTKTTPAYTKAKYEYDKLGRLTKVIYDEKNYIEYTYDANGNITEVKKTTNGITKE